MRILHVIPHYFPAVRYGGPIRSVHGLASASAALGHDVHVYTTSIDGDADLDVPACAAVEKEGVKVRYFPASYGRRVFRSAAMDRALREKVAGFDILHIHYVWVWPTVAAAACARWKGIPYILAPRGMLVPELIKRKSTLQKRIWLSLFDRRNVEKAAAIHVTSETEARDLAALGLRPTQVEIIENGVDAAEHSQDCRSCGSPNQPFGPLKARYIVFLGRICWKKGLDQLLLAMPEVRGADLVIAGYDENGYQSILERLAADVGVKDRVHFLGPVEGCEKWDLLRCAECLVLPSYNENFGMAVIEAMAIGCAVIVSENVGLANVVRDAECGIVTMNTPGALTQAINSLVEAPELAKKMGAAGMRVALGRYSWQGIAKRMEAVYIKCLDHRPACDNLACGSGST